MRTFCIILKWLTLPLFMPIYALLIVLYVPVELDFNTQYISLYFYKPSSKMSLLMIFTIFGTLLPGMSYSIMSRFGMIGSVEMKSQTERRTPIFLMFIYCFALFALLFFQSNYGRNISSFIVALPLSGAMVSLVIWAINFKTKVSLHGSGVGIFCGFLSVYAVYVDSFPVWVVYAAFMFAGIVMFSRLYLSAHTPTQVYTGFSVGFVLTFIINFLML